MTHFPRVCATRPSDSYEAKLPFTGLHLTVFARRPEVNAVVHADPPAATGLASSGSRLLERPFIAEAVVLPRCVRQLEP